MGQWGLPTSFFNARGAPPPLARAAALADSLSSRGPQALPHCLFLPGGSSVNDVMSPSSVIVRTSLNVAAS